jgi:ammonia channel protein AmtB
MQGVNGAGAQAALRQVAAWVPPVARIGYAAKGVVYLLVGWIAFDAAMASGDAEGSTGALASLADESGGRMLLTLIALGLFAHLAWRAVQALLDPEHHHGGTGKRVAMRGFYGISGLVYGSLAVTAWQLAQGGGRGNDDGHEVWVAKLLQQPLGTWLVMLAGLGVITYGLHQLHKAWRGDVNRRLSTGDQQVARGVRVLGRMGTAARGAVLLPIGWFVFNAGRHYRAEMAADTGEVLAMLGEGWLLAVVAIGLFAYGLHQVAKAFYRRIGAPRPG